MPRSAASMGLFSKKAPDPAESCPRCGGPKSASLPLCTTCKMKESAEASPFGFPGSDKDKQARAQGQKWSPQQAQAPPPPSQSPSLSPPYSGSANAPPLPYPAPATPLPYGGAPAAAPRAGSFADAYALASANYPLRSKSGLPVRNAAERDAADFLYDHGIVIAYEPNVAGHRPAFLVPAKSLVIEVAHDLSPLADWQRTERAASYRAYGFSPIHVDGRRGSVVDELKKALASAFPEKTW